MIHALSNEEDMHIMGKMAKLVPSTYSICHAAGASWAEALPSSAWWAAPSGSAQPAPGLSWSSSGSEAGPSSWRLFRCEDMSYGTMDAAVQRVC